MQAAGSAQLHLLDARFLVVVAEHELQIQKRIN